MKNKGSWHILISFGMEFFSSFFFIWQSNSSKIKIISLLNNIPFTFCNFSVFISFVIPYIWCGVSLPLKPWKIYICMAFDNRFLNVNKMKFTSLALCHQVNKFQPHTNAANYLQTDTHAHNSLWILVVPIKIGSHRVSPKMNIFFLLNKKETKSE